MAEASVWGCMDLLWAVVQCGALEGMELRCKGGRVKGGGG